jgi:hypothetical protein
MLDTSTGRSLLTNVIPSKRRKTMPRGTGGRRKPKMSKASTGRKKSGRRK